MDCVQPAVVRHADLQNLRPRHVSNRRAAYACTLHCTAVSLSARCNLTQFDIPHTGSSTPQGFGSYGLRLLAENDVTTSLGTALRSCALVVTEATWSNHRTDTVDAGLVRLHVGQQ